MFGESPVAIPLAFENTKYPSIEEKMTALFWLHMNWPDITLQIGENPHLLRSRKVTVFG